MRRAVVITRGGPYGTNGPLRAGAPVVSRDAELRRLLESARRDGTALDAAGLDEVGLLGGDLCVTLGGPRPLAVLSTDDAVRAPIDVVRATLDGTPHWFVAHLLAHQPGWHGEAAVAMNAERIGDWKLGPRAHPNDGLVDVTFGALGWQDRLKARKRAPTGSHLPHPQLRVERQGTVTLRFRKPTPVVLDGDRVGRARVVELEVEPDALTVVV